MSACSRSCDRFLLPGCLLTASQAICIRPGEKPQDFHHDDTFYTVPRPRPMISISTIAAVDAFTAENGGTEVDSRQPSLGRRLARARCCGEAADGGHARRSLRDVLRARWCIAAGRTGPPRRAWRFPTSIASPGRGSRRISCRACRSKWRGRCRRGCSRCSATPSTRPSWASSPPATRPRRCEPGFQNRVRGPGARRGARLPE